MEVRRRPPAPLLDVLLGRRHTRVAVASRRPVAGAADAAAWLTAPIGLHQKQEMKALTERNFERLGMGGWQRGATYARMPHPPPNARQEMVKERRGRRECKMDWPVVEMPMPVPRFVPHIVCRGRTWCAARVLGF